MKLGVFLQLILYKPSIKTWLIELLIDRSIDWLSGSLTELLEKTTWPGFMDQMSELSGCTNVMD